MRHKRAVVERAETTIDEGLTSVQVRERVSAKLTNRVKRVVGKSYLAIFATNIFTFFNLLGFIIFGLMVFCNSPSNMMFCVVILANTVIGIFQEIRSKIAVEKLSLVSEPTATVVRDCEEKDIPTRDIVIDDMIVYSSGRQISTDSLVIMGEVEVNEAMLTGESESVKKKIGDTLYSGSYIVSGNCYARAERVGADNYVERLSAKVKKFKQPHSELMRSIKLIIKVISLVIFPLGVATFLTGNFDLSQIEGIKAAILPAAGSMIGMVPSGMVLLTSVALAVSVIKLVRKKVLVQELYCIEMLARVDTLCLDKTGTITDGSMTVEEIDILDKKYEKDLSKIIASVVNATGDNNTTAEALKKRFTSENIIASSVALPFSSKRKFSAATLDNYGTFAIGAAEFMIKNLDKEIGTLCENYLKRGLRVLLVAHSAKSISDEKVAGLKPVAVLALSDTVRSDAAEIIKWFKDNSVAVKVISGDNPLSVSVIAGKVGIENADKYISLDGLTDEEVTAAANEYTVFGRVTPDQKALLVRSMKKAGRTVAMTGDGVNDILAMRESDCAISVGCGSDAAKTVAHLVLTDNQFGSMPKVVAEGRQVVNNIQNSSSLFLMKTSMTILTTLLVLFLPYKYPFEAKNLYAMEFFVIGISSFLLALKPNHNLIHGKFIPNTLKNTLPSGIAMFLSVGLVYAFLGILGLSDNNEMMLQEISTITMFAMTGTGVCALLILLFPYDLINIGIGALSVAGTVGSYYFIPWIFNLVIPFISAGAEKMVLFVDIPANAIWFLVCEVACMALLIILGKFVINKIDKRNGLKKLAEVTV